MKNKNKEDKDFISAYRTYALAEKEKTDPESNTTNPSLTAVEAAKEWVDRNHK
jgi:hypothetical protein